MNERPLDADALHALQRQDDDSYTPLSTTPLMLCDLSAPLTADALNWLQHQPCPIIGVGGAQHPAAVEACDAWVETATDAAPLIAGIRHAPLAAAVLVQLLRLTSKLSLEDALVAESLAYATLQNGAEFRRWLSAYRATEAAITRDPGPAVQLTRDGDRLQLTLNRPGNRNAMTVEMRDALCEALKLVLADDTLTEVRIDAAGKCFSTGGDLAEFGSAPDSATAHAVRCLALPGRLLARCRERTIVTLHGACIGSGIEFPSFAGRLVAKPNTWFQLPELKYGLIPGAGGCVGVMRRIGRQRTAWMVLGGARIDARTALNWGLIDAIDDA